MELPVPCSDTSQTVAAANLWGIVSGIQPSGRALATLSISMEKLPEWQTVQYADGTQGPPEHCTDSIGLLMNVL